MYFAMKWHMTPESDLVDQCTGRQGVLEPGSCASHVNSMIICAQGLVHSILSGPSQSVLEGSVRRYCQTRKLKLRVDVTHDYIIGQRESWDSG